MSIEDADATSTIVESGRRRVQERMREAFDAHLEVHPELDAFELDDYIDAAVAKADAGLWRISLAEAAAQEYGLSVGETLGHPAVAAAERVVGATAEPAAAGPASGSDDDDDDFEPELGARSRNRELGGFDDDPEDDDEDATEPVDPDALRLAAVHLGGIEALADGESDLELRLSPSGLDVLTRSTGTPIGRLEWREIVSVEVTARKGLLRARGHELAVHTGRGEATFGLPEISAGEVDDELRPALARLHESARS